MSEFQAALDGSACLGTWLHDIPAGQVALSPSLAALLGIVPAAAGVALAQVLAGIHPEDRLRIESVLHAAGEAGGPFEAEFRTRPGTRGVRWLRLMGRSERDVERDAFLTRGLAFDLTEGRLGPGTPAQRAQRQVNQLADHVIAMQGLVASLSNPPLSRLVEEVAAEIGFELARHLQNAEGGRRHSTTVWFVLYGIAMKARSLRTHPRADRCPFSGVVGKRAPSLTVRPLAREGPRSQGTAPGLG